MTTLKTNHSVLREPFAHGTFSRLGSFFLTGLVIVFGLLVAWKVPSHLIPALVASMAFVAALVAGLLAYLTRGDGKSQGLSLTDVAGLLAAVWVVASLFCQSDDLAALLSLLTTV
jgi:hypothetical protein